MTKDLLNLAGLLVYLVALIVFVIVVLNGRILFEDTTNMLLLVIIWILLSDKIREK